MSKIMTAEEWIAERDKIVSDAQVVIKSGKIVGCDFALAEEYAAYYHAEMSKPPKDVEEAIELKYPTVSESDDLDVAVSIDCNNAARFGYSLANKRIVELEQKLKEYNGEFDNFPMG